MIELLGKVCIVLSKPSGYSETFIKAHIEHLNAKVLYASSFPDSGEELVAVDTSGDHIKELAQSIYKSGSNQVKKIELRNFFKKNKPLLVLAEYGYTGVKALDYCKKKGIPLAVHFHGYDAYRKDILEKYEKSYKSLFEYACAIIVVSKDMQQQIISLGAPPDKVFYNVYGVDINKFEISEVLNSGKQLVAVGRFVEKKAPYLIILAFKKVLDLQPDAKLVMIGDGPLLDVCRQIIDSLGISDCVSLYGALSHEEVAKVMQASRAFIQHSVMPASRDSEGTPNTILEAQACGLPVISTKHAGIKDVIIHNETGFLVEEGDIDSMANYMVELLENKERAFEMGSKGRKHIEDNYLMRDRIDKLKEILNNCIKK